MNETDAINFHVILSISKILYFLEISTMIMTLYSKFVRNYMVFMLNRINYVSSEAVYDCKDIKCFNKQLKRRHLTTRDVSSRHKECTNKNFVFITKKKSRKRVNHENLIFMERQLKIYQDSQVFSSINGMGIIGCRRIWTMDSNLTIIQREKFNLT